MNVRNIWQKNKLGNINLDEKVLKVTLHFLNSIIRIIAITPLWRRGKEMEPAFTANAKKSSWVYHNYVFEQHCFFYTLQHQKLWKVCKAFLMANITTFSTFAVSSTPKWKKIGKQLYAFNVFVKIVLLQNFFFFFAVLGKFYEIESRVKVRFMEFAFSQQINEINLLNKAWKKKTFHTFSHFQIIRSNL